VAVAFAITGGFGLKESLQGLLLEYFSENKKFVELIIGFAENIVESSQKGLFGIISFLFFLWTVIWLILSIEQCFNEIWKVERSRSFAKRVLYYIGILIFAPFLITIFLSVSLVFKNAFLSVGNGLKHFESISFVVQWLMFYGIVLLIFTVMYKFIPAIKVNFSAAFWAASITAVAFIVVQYLYMETQLMVTRLNSIYGAFAAIPLFLIWMNVSWTIILVGAEISHAYQYENSYSSGNSKYLKEQVKRKILFKENKENEKL
jgi:Predicted membrane protein